MLMRVAPGSSMRLVDLRQLSVHQLASLLDEEAALWRSELHWDYQFSIDLIKKFLDSHSLAGVVAFEDERPAGYGFYVVEDHKGMLGGLFVSPRYAQTGIGEQILGDIVQTLRGTPQVTRIEAQLMPFGASLEGLLTRNDFRLFPRRDNDICDLPVIVGVVQLNATVKFHFRETNRLARWRSCHEITHSALRGFTDDHDVVGNAGRSRIRDL